MGQRRPVHEVADRVDALHVGAHRAVDLDQPVLGELDAGGVQAQRLDVGAAAGGDDQPVHLARLVAVGERARCASADSMSVTSVLVWTVDALPLEAALGELGDVGVLGRQHAVERLEQRSPRRPAARSAEAISEPDAPAPTTAIDAGSSSSAHASSVPITRPPNCAPGIGRLTEPVASTIVLAEISWPPTRERALAGERGLALDQVDLVLLQQPGDAAGERRDDLLAALGDAGVVDLRLGHLDAELAGLADLGQDVGDAEHGLGGDAGVVQAAAADPVLLDARRSSSRAGRRGWRRRSHRARSR